MNSDIIFREASVSDIPAITQLILEHGPNPWNHLPEADVREHVAGIDAGHVAALVATLRRKLIGVVTFELGKRYAQYQPPDQREEVHGYLAEAVVHRDHAGQGIGSKLFRAAAERIFACGIRAVYAMHHEENAASAGMMRKSGFTVVDTFDDPAIRPNGSRRTTVERLTADVSR